MTPQEEIIHVELSVLKALCRGSMRGPAAINIRARLAGYSWHDPIHQVICRALLSIPFTDPQIIRDLLPARLTLYGFPDVKYEDLFDPAFSSPENLEQLVEWLLQRA